MVKLKKIISSIIVLVITIMGILSESYAVTKVTEENLKEALQDFVKSSANEGKYQISMEDKKINVTSGQGSATINYDLKDKVVFTYVQDIKQGMSYKEFKTGLDGSGNIIVGFFGVAKIQGVEYEDSISYGAMNILAGALNEFSFNSSDDKYIIFDDTKSEGTVEKDGSNPKMIYASEFGEHVMEYVKSLYGEKSTIKDEKALNVFEYTTELKDVTETSCKIVTTLTVDTEKDFSEMKGFKEKASKSFENNVNKENNNESTNKNEQVVNKKDDEVEIKNNNENNINSTENTNNIKQTANENKTISNKLELPKTGSYEIIGFGVVAISIAIAFGIKLFGYRDVK